VKKIEKELEEKRRSSDMEKSEAVYLPTEEAYDLWAEVRTAGLPRVVDD